MLDLAAQRRLCIRASLPSSHLEGIHAVNPSGEAGVPVFTSQPSSILGSSPLSFESAAKTFAIVVALSSTATISNDPRLATLLVPQSIEVPGATSKPLGGVGVAESRIGAFKSILGIKQDLYDEPIEDGITHKAERRVVSHLLWFGEEGLLDAVRSSEPPERSASLLRLLGRSSSLSGQLRENLVTWGLSSSCVEVRDAAVQAVENWADRPLVKLLREHGEPVGWLRDYAANIVRDLEG